MGTLLHHDLTEFLLLKNALLHHDLMRITIMSIFLHPDLTRITSNEHPLTS